AAVLALVEVFDVLDVVARVEERRLLEADVHEGGLHAGEHPEHAALHHAADHAAALVALDVELDELLLLEDRDAGLARGRVDQDLVLHARPSERARGPGWNAASGGGVRAGGRRGARDG